jgi:hypothetical protein
MPCRRRPLAAESVARSGGQRRQGILPVVLERGRVEESDAADLDPIREDQDGRRGAEALQGASTYTSCGGTKTWCPGSMAPSRYELSEAQWERIRDFLPGRREHVGRTAADNRVFVNGVLRVLRSRSRLTTFRSATASTKACTSVSCAGLSPAFGTASFRNR